MSVQGKVNGLLLLTTAWAVTSAVSWRRRARQVSEPDLGAHVSHQLTELMTAPTTDAEGNRKTTVSTYVVEAKNPPDAACRWFWWVAATCSYCSTDQAAEVHDARSGWEATAYGAVVMKNQLVRWFLYDAHSCPVLLAELHAAHIDDEDDTDDDGDPADATP